MSSSPLSSQLNGDPLEFHMYIIKLGFAKVYMIFLISVQGIHCWYMIEPPAHRGSFNEYPQSIFCAKIRKYHTFSLENCHYYDRKIHTCDTFLNPYREIWNFWSGNLCLVSGGFHVANFGLFLPKLKSRNLVTLLEICFRASQCLHICQPK